MCGVILRLGGKLKMDCKYIKYMWFHNTCSHMKQMEPLLQNIPACTVDPANPHLQAYAWLLGTMGC